MNYYFFLLLFIDKWVNIGDHVRKYGTKNFIYENEKLQKIQNTKCKEMYGF